MAKAPVQTDTKKKTETKNTTTNVSMGGKTVSVKTNTIDVSKPKTSTTKTTNYSSTSNPRSAYASTSNKSTNTYQAQRQNQQTTGSAPKVNVSSNKSTSVLNKVEDFLNKYLTTEGVNSLPNSSSYKQFSQKLDSNFSNNGTVGSSFITSDSVALNNGREASNRLTTETLLNGGASYGNTLSSMAESVLKGIEIKPKESGLGVDINWNGRQGYKLDDKDLDKLPSTLIDKRTGQKADDNYVNSLYNSVNNEYNDINASVEQLNADYKNGLINDTDYVNAYQQLQKRWDSTSKNAEELGNYDFLSGKDYYNWLKQNGSPEEIKDFEAYVGSFDDSYVESLSNSFKAALVDHYSRPFQMVEMIKSYIDHSYDYNDDSHISTQMKIVADELKSYTSNGANDEGLRNYSLQTISSLIPMIIDTVEATFIAPLLGINSAAGITKFASTYTNIEMGMGSASETMRTRLEQGNTVETSFWDAIIHGGITAAVEFFNVGNIANITGLFTGAGLNVMGVGLLGLPKFTQMVLGMNQDGVGEAVEEAAESYATYWADSLYNAILGATGSDERLIVDPVTLGGIGDMGLTDQMIMAYGGAFLLGLPTNVAMTIDSVQKYNAAGESVKYWRSAAEFYRNMDGIDNAQMAQRLENADMCDAIADFIENERKPFAQMSQMKDAVQFMDDIPEPAPSIDETMNLVANAFKLDVGDQFNAYEQNLEQINWLKDTIQNEIDSRGYGGMIDLETYAKATPEIRNESKKIMEFAKDIGTDLRITDEFDYLKDGQIVHKQMGAKENGVAVYGDTIVVNPFAKEIMNGQETMESVFSHELTHITEKTGKYKELESIVRKAMGDQWGIEFTRLSKQYGSNENVVNPEIVANYIQKNMGNEKFLQTLSDYNDSLFTKIYTGMKSMLSADPNSKVAKKFFEAYNERINDAMSRNDYTNVFGDLISATDCQFNLAQYNEKGRYVLVDYLHKQVQKGNLDSDVADEIYNTLEFYYTNIEEMTKDPDSLFKNFTNWSVVNMTKDQNDLPQLTCVVSNGDYKMNIDFSTVCKKRKVADAVFNELARDGILDKRALTDTEIARMREIIKENKLEVSCSLCFVDSKRFNQGSWADTFVNGKEAKVDQKLVDLGVQDPETKHIMGWNEMVDLLANDPNEIGDFNFANRTKTNEGTLHTLSDKEVNQDGLNFLKNVAKNTKANSEIGRISRALVKNPELRKHMLLGDLYGSEALGNIKRGNQDLFKAVNTHQGVAKPKSPYLEVTYNNEIITMGIFDPVKAREVGGVRIQSFSDFMANMVFDYMEMVAELQAKGLTAHSYTKVKEFAELFGQTGIKINLSIIPKATTMTAEEFKQLSDDEKAEVKKYAGLERFSLEEVKNMSKEEKEKLVSERGLSLSEDGSCYTAYIFEDESFDWLDALELQTREGYDKNVGTICVGVSDEHIWKMMADDNVKMIIPYHKSSLNPIVAHMMNIGAYNDYTDTQNTRAFVDGKWKSLGTLKKADFKFYKSGMMTNGYDPKATSLKYLEWCEKKNYLPKFAQFAFVNDENGEWALGEDGVYRHVGEGGNLSVNENYYKVLVDFRPYDINGNLAAQEDVKQNYPENFMDMVKQSLLNYEDVTNEQRRIIPSIVEDFKNELESKGLQFNLAEDTETETESDEQTDSKYFDYGMNPARHIDILKKTDYGHTFKTVRTIANSEHIDEDFAERMKTKTEMGAYVKEIQHDRDVIDRAISLIKKNGFAKSYENVLKSNSLDTANIDLTMGILLVDEMEAKGLGGTPEFEKLVEKCVQMGNSLGLGLRTVSLFKRMTPVGQVITIESEIQRIQEGLIERYKSKAPNLTVPQELLDEYVDPKTSDERRGELRGEIAQKIADQIPPTFWEKLNALRHLSMLFNPRTWVKNRLGNEIFGYINEVTRAERAAFESLFSHFNDDFEREAGVYNPLSKTDREMYKRFVEDYKQFATDTENKYVSSVDAADVLLNTQFGREVSEHRKQFDTKFMNWLVDVNANMLSDMPGKSKAYAKSMVGYFKANNLDPDTVTPKQMEKAREFATKEALYATFNTENQLANAIINYEKFGDKHFGSVGSKVNRLFVESFIPFKRTPLNLVKTGMSYTPLGFIKSVVYDGMWKVYKGEFNANQFINYASQGLTGTGIFLLGALLSKLGIFRTKDDDKDRKKYFDKDNGEQDYSLVFKNFTYTLEWLDPIIIALAMGAEFQKLTADKGLSAEDLYKLGTSMAQPIFDTTMMSGITNNLKSYANDDAEYTTDIGANAITNYASQYIPSIFGAIARTFDDTRRSTAVTNGKLDKFFKKSVLGKIPGANEPYINKKGEEQKNPGNLVGRAVLNFLSPGYYAERDIDKYDEEMYRLYEQTGDVDALPSSTTKDITFNKEPMKFTAGEYTEWHKTRWKKETELVNQFMDSDSYQSLSDEERVKTIEDIRSYAQKVAKKQFLESRGYTYTDDKELAEKQPDKYVYDKELTNVDGAIDSGMDAYQYFDYENNAGSKQTEKMEYLENSNLTEKEKKYLWEQEGYKTSYEDVYKKVFGKGNSKSTGKSSNKKSNSTSKKKKSSTKAKNVSSSLKGGGSATKIRTNRATPIKGNTNFKKAYQNVFSQSRQGSKNVSSGSSSGGVCPNCGARVSANASRCPNCGAKL